MDAKPRDRAGAGEGGGGGVAAVATRALADVPGPKGVPLLGNALQMRGQELHQQLEAWATQFGNPFRFRIGSRQFLGVSDAAQIASVLRRRPEVFGRGPRVTQVCKDLGLDGVFSANGETWRRQRPFVMAGLDPTHLKAFLPAITDITARLKTRWMRAAQDGREIDLLADLMRYTVDVTTGLAFGRSLDTLGQDEGGEVIQQHLNAIFPAMLRRTMAPFDFEHWLPPRAIRRHAAALQLAVQGFIRDTRERLRRQPQLAQRPENLLQAMVLACDSDDAQVRLTDEELSGNVLTMLVAGEDTTANTLGWLVWLLHGHPAHWAQARAEVEAAVGPAGQVQSLEQLSALDFVEACTHEAMRLKPVAPLIFLYAQQDAVVGDVAVPRGAFVACLMRPAGLLEQPFAAPQAFDPARWMAGGHAAQEGGVLSAKRTVMPFGGGPRVCPGRYLALAEIKMVMAMLLAGFDIRAMTTPPGGPHEKMSFVMSPEGLSVRLALRA